MAETPAGIQRFVVKVGSSVLTDEAGRLVPERVQQLVSQVVACVKTHRQPVIVSSGAIACGMARLSLSARPKALAQQQACAAIGQSELMHLYSRAFREHGVVAAQILLTQEDLADRTRFRNARQTLLTLLHRHAVPIVNENDTVSVEEITFGDNDRLAALVAAAVDAQLLVLLSDVDGLLQDGKVVERVEALERRPRTLVAHDRRSPRKGGMAAKLEAARIAGHHGIPMVIARGTRTDVLPDLLSGEPIGTLFVPPTSRLAPKKWWIAFALRQPTGTIVVDRGAEQALVEGGKSLLATGVKEVRGRFEAGSCVTIEDESRHELARGLSNFSSSELLRVRGMRSAQIGQLLGSGRPTEVVHRDHLVLAREVQS